MGRRGMGRRGARRTMRRRRRRRRRRVMLVGGLIGLGAYKLGKRDVDRIEQHTGISAEELTDEELERAMDELHIEKQYRDAADAEAGPGGAVGAEGSDYLDELKQLAELHQAGILTDEEFEAKKAQILDSN